MNNITTCPNCLTRFIVDRSQLESHQGQVKCAKCQHVFDFRQHLESAHAQTVFLRGSRTKNRRTYLIIALLTLLALGQTLFVARTDILTRWPAVQQPFIKACQLLHCKDPLPKQIKLIRLEGAEVIQDENVPELIKLNALLTNNAPYIQAYPELELTLTDANDQAVMRKKIEPEEYTNHVKDGLKAGEELHININLETTEAVTGFRVAPVYR
jgi:predicted Zn finger-like uncharacterized protein